MQSIWEQTAKAEHFPPLSKDLNTDVLIIGGGVCGILCAYMLHRAGIDYVLAEADRICSGITKNTTAKITVQHGLIYHKLLKKFGAEKAGLYFHANDDALKQYAALCENIDCDFSREDSFVYTMDSYEKIRREIDALKALGINAQFSQAAFLPFRTAGAVKLPNQAQFNPLKFAYAISKGLHICEHTKVEQLIGTKAITPHGNITAKKVIVATHFPFLNKHGSYFLKLYQHRSYVLALKNVPLPSGMYVDEAKTGFSFRTYGDLLLLGGGAHRTGKQGGSWQALRNFAKQYYPNAQECACWAAQDCMSLDGIPYIGRYSANTQGLYVATGFNKWGMTTSMAAARLLCDLVQEKSNPYAALFSPSRSILQPQLAINAWEAAASLLTPTSKRCPHLGCALKWNPNERTWDCPCHGSRFTEDGKCIDNPSTGDLT